MFSSNVAGDFPSAHPGGAELWTVNLRTGEKRRLDVEGRAPAVVVARTANGSPTGESIRRHGSGTCGPSHAGGARRRGSPTMAPPTGARPGRQARTTCTFPAIAAEPRTCGGFAIDERTGGAQGDIEPVTAPTNVAVHPTISADGKRLAYASYSWATTVFAVGFDPVKLEIQGRQRTIVAGGLHLWSGARVSADGSQIALVRWGHQHDLFVVAGRWLRVAAAHKRRSGRALSGLVARRQTYSLWPDGSDRGQPGRHRCRDRKDHAGIRPASRRRGMSVMVDRRFADRHDAQRPRSGNIRDALEAVGLRPWIRTASGGARRRVRTTIVVSRRPVARGHNRLAARGFFIRRLGPTASSPPRALRPSPRTRRGFPADATCSSRGLSRTDLLVADLSSQNVRRVLSVAPQIIRGASITRDGTQLVVSAGSEEGDIWMATLPPSR